ncbi:sugar-binding transcriptional regulator [Alicyclobacillus cycloheptanicus]|uniref:DNA-binding transcriptional regulator LsrR (DeoR family) n=1 Tax=Alicyclobacillus cycloheptanicus TaxID=1457 RepID=A0ABT9XLL2_9BACL|nr:sugar-binding transcriptional regulator [Alicyclobacillus cycloheptanicus]MDQ0191197.1 DNA-binding transcriptional regulator LsrR (DeoR family) [Alicyclobacillus cycloheptanicus]WDM02111.1 sugar-binding transcriptional regulator [Alicyclobacillus cycloheptanicus]
MAYSDDSRILSKIAHMYYEDGNTQAEIAETLGVSRPLISKYLAKAKELGIVQISIRDEVAHPYAAVEAELERTFGLREAIVVSESGDNSVKKALGAAAGQYLIRIVKDNDIVGVSGGTTLLELANEMPKANLPSVTIVPLIGGIGDSRIDVHSNTIVVRIAERLNADYKLLHAPAVVDTADAKAMFLQQSSIAEVVQQARQAKVALVGIGGYPEYSTMVRNYMGPDRDRDLMDSDVIGDICYNFINAKGEASNVSWNSRVIAISLKDLKAIPTVVGIAHGAEKLEAIRASLIARLVNVLVTDYTTAQGLLSHAK